MTAINPKYSIKSVELQISKITDDSLDFTSVPVDTYFFNLSDRLVYYKNKDGYSGIVTELNPKNNNNSSVDPTLTNDQSEFYSIGSYWFNLSTKKLWVCVDNSVGSAIWKLTTLTDNDGNIVVPGGLQFGGGYSSATLTGNTNNLLVADLSSSVLLRLETTGNYQLTGIVVPDSRKAFFFSIFNIGLSGNILFKNENAGSTDVNRFSLGGDVTVQPGEGLTFIYDPVDQRWRSPGKNI